MIKLFQLLFGWLSKPHPAHLTPNFHLSEFACRDGSPVPRKYYGNVMKLARCLQALRDLIEVPIHINSGYRTVSHNTKVGGARNSQHLTASAADIVVVGMTPANVAALIQSLINTDEMSEGGIGIYNTFVHYDIRGTKARWRG